METRNRNRKALLFCCCEGALCNQEVRGLPASAHALDTLEVPVSSDGEYPIGLLHAPAHWANRPMAQFRLAVINCTDYGTGCACDRWPVSPDGLEQASAVIYGGCTGPLTGMSNAAAHSPCQQHPHCQSIVQGQSGCWANIELERLVRFGHASMVATRPEE